MRLVSGEIQRPEDHVEVVIGGDIVGVVADGETETAEGEGKNAVAVGEDIGQPVAEGTLVGDPADEFELGGEATALGSFNDTWDIDVTDRRSKDRGGNVEPLLLNSRGRIEDPEREKVAVERGPDRVGDGGCIR